MKKTQILTEVGHQGDINFRKIDKLPDILKPAKYDQARGGYTLALGEHSGHAHVVVAERTNANVLVWLDEKGRSVLQIFEPTMLVHGTFTAPAKINETELDKHDAIKLMPGIYQQDFEEEYDPFLQKAVQVRD